MKRTKHTTPKPVRGWTMNRNQWNEGRKYDPDSISHEEPGEWEIETISQDDPRWQETMNKFADNGGMEVKIIDSMPVLTKWEDWKPKIPKLLP